MVREENEHHQSTQNVNELNENPVSWVNQQGCGENESMTSGSDDYMVISIKRTKNVTELKIPGACVQVEVSGKKMCLWIDSGSPVTIFSINDLFFNTLVHEIDVLEFFHQQNNPSYNN